MTVTVLGSGTSHGVPAIACKCPVCCSSDPCDKRTRASVLVTQGNTNILIDIGPDFRAQALRQNITHISAVLLTHSHADHLHGLDDIRIFSHTESEHHGPSAPMNIWGNAETLHDVRNRFDYIFTHTQAGGGKPLLCLKDVATLDSAHPNEFGSLTITAVPMLHGNCHTTGYIFQNLQDASNKEIASLPSQTKAPSFVYLTDCNNLPSKSLSLIKEITLAPTFLIIDGLRPSEHTTHFSYLEALDIANELKAKNTFLTHISHAMSHKDIKNYINSHLQDFPALCFSKAQGGIIEPTFDSLTFSL